MTWLEEDPWQQKLSITVMWVEKDIISDFFYIFIYLYTKKEKALEQKQSFKEENLFSALRGTQDGQIIERRGISKLNSWESKS